MDDLQSGTFAIGGKQFSVDKASDTVDDVIGRINAADVGVEASYEDNRLRLTATDKLSSFELENGTSGLFDAFAIDAGVYEPRKISRSGGEGGLQEVGLVKRSLKGLGRSLAGLFALDIRGARLPDFVGSLSQAIRASFDDDDRNSLDTGLGLRFRLKDTTDPLRIDSGLSIDGMRRPASDAEYREVSNSKTGSRPKKEADHDPSYHHTRDLDHRH